MRKQLPLPDGIAPARRPPPPAPVDDDTPPPPVPTRPRPSAHSSGPPVPSSSKPVAKVPAYKPPPPVQEDMYDEGDAGEVYAEPEGVDSADSISEEEQENYDDMEVGAFVKEEEAVDEGPTENYDAFGGVGDEFEQNEYEVEEEQEEYQECDIGGAIQEDEYQVPDENLTQTNRNAPALPPPRPKQSRDGPPPPGPRDTPKKPPVPKGVGMPAIGMGDIQNIKNQLKKVSSPKNETKPNTEPKQYVESNELQQKFNFFKQKEKEALARGNKPAITPKPFNFKKSTPVKEEKTDSPETHTRPSDRLLPPHRKANDSPPSVPDTEENDLPPPPPPLSDLPSHGGHRDLPPPPVSEPPKTPGHRQLPPPPVSGTPNHRELPTPPLSSGVTPDPPSRGKDGYTKVNPSEEQNNNIDEYDDDQEVYDEAISLVDPLMKESWYFGELDRAAGNEKLKKLNQNGGYLLRKSKQGGDKQPYTLMVIFRGHVYNLKIRERNDGRVALGEEKPDEMSFPSVKDLILHHQHNDVILVHRDGKQDTTLLVKCPPK